MGRKTRTSLKASCNPNGNQCKLINAQSYERNCYIRLMRDTCINVPNKLKIKTDNAEICQCHLVKTHKRFGRSPSSV